MASTSMKEKYDLRKIDSIYKKYEKELVELYEKNGPSNDIEKE